MWVWYLYRFSSYLKVTHYHILQIQTTSILSTTPKPSPQFCPLLNNTLLRPYSFISTNMYKAATICEALWQALWIQWQHTIKETGLCPWVPYLLALKTDKKTGEHTGVWRVLGTLTYSKSRYNQIPAGPCRPSQMCCIPWPHSLHPRSFLRAREVSAPLGVNHPLWVWSLCLLLPLDSALIPSSLPFLSPSSLAPSCSL